MWTHKQGSEYMDKKLKRDEGYHAHLVEIRVRFPETQSVQDPVDKTGKKQIDEILLKIRNRAKTQGFIDKKSKEGSVNAYILNLIEKDIQQEDSEFTINRSLKNQ